MQFLMADAIASRILPVVDENIKPLREWDVYPDLFKEEKERFDAAMEDAEFEKFKERRRRFAAEHNSMM